VIGRLRGVLAARRGGAIVVDCAGVGYRVQTPPGARLPQVGDDVVVHTHLHVREDVMALYGFPTESERDLFELLLNCPGVGPKVALACLSVLSPEQLTAAVVAGDHATLTLVPGIGRRSAEKLVFELRPRLGADGVVPVDLQASGHAEAREALAALGYGDKEVAAALADVPADDDVGAMLRVALRRLGGGSDDVGGDA
jgi:Holliday junction DNA helicase RuvA